MATNTRKTETPFANMFKAPTFDVSAVLEANRKNFEALMEANRVAFEGYKTVAEKHIDLVRKTMEQASGAAGDMFAGKTPEANATKQIELAQGLARSGFDGYREVAELAMKANREAFEVIQKRFNESVEEVKAQQTAA